MKFNTKIAFAGLAGLAIASGAGYYLYNRRKNNQKDPKYLLQELRNALFGQKSIPFNEIMQKFNQSYNQSLGKYLLEQIQENNDNSEIKSRFCKKVLDRLYFYECLDCSATIKHSPLDQQEKENLNIYSHQLCEDCFDQEIHKGHKYKLIQSQNEGRCDCGFSYLVQESSFCCKHSGFKQLKDEFQQQITEEVKQKIISYFKDLIYILVDGQSDLLYAQMKKEKVDCTKVQKDEFFVSYNILITLIIDQILQLLNENHKFVFIFAQLLKETFEKPIRYIIDIEKYNLLDEKAINNEITLFEYILINQTLLNEKSVQKLNSLLEIISTADSEFLEFICLKYMKLIKYAIFVKEQKDQTGESILVFSVPQIQNACRIAFANQPYTDKVCLENEDYVINLANVLRTVTSQMSFSVMSDYEVIYLLSPYISDIFNSMDTIEKFNRLEELLEIILDIYENSFENIHLICSQKQDIFEYMSMNLGKLGGNIGVQSIIQDLLYTLTPYAHSGLNLEKKEMILRVLSKRYKSLIERDYQKSQEYKALFKQDKLYLGLSYASLIINIVVISEGSELSTENVMKAIKKNFQLSNEQEIDDFINKIAYILNCNILIYSYHINAYVMIPFTQGMQAIPEYSQAISQLWNCLLFSDNCIYDSNILALQLITSIQKNSDSIIYKLADQYTFCQEQHIKYIQLIKPINIITTVMFDQTPFINVNKKLKNILSNGNEDLQQRMEYAVKQVINNNIKWHPNKAKSFQQFLQQIQQSIYDKNIILQALKSFGDFNQDNDALNIQPLESLENVSFNIARYFNNLQDENLQNQRSPYRLFLIQDGVFQKLYKQQQNLIVKNLISSELLNKIKEQVLKNTESQQILLMVTQFDFYFYLWVILIKLNENEPEIFSQEQAIKIKEFKNILLTADNFNIFKPMFIFLLKFIQERQFPKPKCLLLNDMYEELEKNNSLN